MNDQVLTSQPYILFGSSFPKDKEYTQVGISYENNTHAVNSYCIQIVHVEAGGVES